VGGGITSLEDVADMGDAKPLQISVEGPDMAKLDSISAQVVRIIEKCPARST
jgi:tRNA(Ser,Leu) C12 N-acetylase TAN1